nr:hypothetical protein [Tanacetum cinerariifolium]
MGDLHSLPFEFVDDTDFALDIPTDGQAIVEMVNAIKDNFDEDDLVKFQELLLEAEKPLYEGCPDFTKLSAIVKLLNLKGKYECSNKFFTELLELLKKMLPAGYLGNDIAVFLEWLVDDLHTLFETGVNTYDASTKDNFNLPVVVLWTINDYPALGTLCGCLYSGFKESKRRHLMETRISPGSESNERGTNIQRDQRDAEETITEETIEFLSEFHKSMETIGIPPDKHETGENEEGKPLSAGKSSEVSTKLF